MYDFTRSIFTGLPVKASLPPDTKCIIVNDFFVEDLVGGAELTTEALIKKSPVKCHKIRSNVVTPELIKNNTDKHWIICNFAQLNALTIAAMIETANLNYSLVEFDYKYCVYRSPYKHFMETNQPCDCPNTPHGQTIEKLFQKASKVFWMAEKQKQQYLEVLPSLNVPDKHIIQSSTFDDETLSKLKLLRSVFKESDEKKNKIWSVQQSNSWIKGTEATVNWCKQKAMNIKVMGNMPYEQFLVELAKSYGLVFRPLDSDTCPRVVIEAKLLGLEMELNNNVVHKDEPWFKGSIEDAETYLLSRGDNFWSQIVPMLEKK